MIALIRSELYRMATIRSSWISIVLFGSVAASFGVLLVVPIMAVFGAALAATVRRSSWLLYGFAVWFILVEGLIGHLNWELPISSYRQASEGDAFGLEIFISWAIVAVAVAALTLPRDLTAD